MLAETVIFLYGVQMSESEPALSSQEYGEEIGQLLEFRQGVLQRQQEDTARFNRLDSPELNERLWRQAYYEVNINTPSKRVLWSAEEAVQTLTDEVQSEHTDIYFHRFKPATLLPLIVEGYAAVSPGEGYRLISAMPDDEIKVEAMARFGKALDSGFVLRALQLALRISQNDYYDRHDVLLNVADFGGDDAALHTVFKNVIQEGTNTGFGEWEHVDNLIKLASLGHAPALLLLKEQLPRFKTEGHESHEDDHWLGETALVAYIDELVKRGEIPVRVATEEKDASRLRAAESAWQDYLMQNRHGIQDKLKKGVYLPRFDRLADSFPMMQHHIADCTSFKTENDTLRYIDNMAEKYGGVILSKGERVIPRLWSKDIGKFDKSLRRPEKELKQDYENTVQMMGGRAMASYLMGRQSTFEHDLEIHNGYFRDTMVLLNKVALIKAMASAAPKIQN